MREQKFLGGNDAHEVIFFVHHVTGVNGLLIDGGLANFVERLVHRHGRMQGNELHRHDATGAVLGVLQKFVDAAPRLLVAACEQLFDHVCRHLFQDICDIVKEQVVHNAVDLQIVELADQSFLLVRIDLDESFGGEVLGEQTEQKGEVLFFHRFKSARGVDGVHLGKKGF